MPNELQETQTPDTSATSDSQQSRRVFDPNAPEAPVEATPVEEVMSLESPEEEEIDVDFASLFEAEASGPLAHYFVGERIEGVIVEIGVENIFVDVGAKTEAFTSRDEYTDSDGELTVAKGDTLKGIVVSIQRGGQLQIAQKMQRGQAANAAILAASDNGIPVEGTITGINKGGYEVEVMGQRAFCPLSQIEMAFTQTPEVHLNATYNFRVTEYSQKGGKFVISRAALQREDAAAKAEITRAKLKVDAVLDGVVRSLQPYGAFVDIGGLDGLVHISEITHGHIKHPSEILAEGEEVRVKVLSIKKGPKGEKISLSIKKIGENPWEKVISWIKLGENYTGKVVRLAPFGAFIELQPGVEGLLHVSEMSWERRIHDPSEVLEMGQAVEVAVISLDLEARRVSLSLKATLSNPWEGAAERFPVGIEVSGTIERTADFGLFVRLQAGIVALFPLSEMGLAPGTSRDQFEVGQEIHGIVLSIDEEQQRISVSRKALQAYEKGGDAGDSSEKPRKQSQGRGRGQGQGQGRGRGQDDERRSARRSGPTPTYREAGRNFATFGDLLMKKLAKKGNDPS